MKELEICWNITARCNQNCKYCHRFLNLQDLSFDENLQILNLFFYLFRFSLLLTDNEIR